MMTELEELQKVDLLRERMRCGYEEARAALDGADGSLTAALAALERGKRSASQDVFGLVGELLAEFGDILQEAPIRKLRLRFGDKTLSEFPLYAAGAAALAVTLAALLISQTSVEVERDPPAPESAAESAAEPATPPAPVG